MPFFNKILSVHPQAPVGFIRKAVPALLCIRSICPVHSQLDAPLTDDEIRILKALLPDTLTPQNKHYLIMSFDTYITTELEAKKSEIYRLLRTVCEYAKPLSAIPESIQTTFYDSLTDLRCATDVIRLIKNLIVSVYLVANKRRLLAYSWARDERFQQILEDQNGGLLPEAWQHLAPASLLDKFGNCFFGPSVPRIHPE